MSTHIIVHKFKYVFALFILMVLLSAKTTFATEVLGIKIDPPSPVYDQPFKCTLTLNQDDHRNACDLMPLNASDGMFPWDICRIDHISNDALTRFYNCIANKDRKVPGPGNYQIVVWNFTGDGETGQVIARQNISILDQPPPTPTNAPSPTPTTYVPPKPTIAIVTQIPPQLPSQNNNFLPPQKIIPTVVELSISPIKINDQIKNNALSLEVVNKWKQQISNGYVQIVERTQHSVLRPLYELLLNFMKEANY